MRLHFLVEGQTEEAFVRDLLVPAMAPRGIYCDVHCVTTGRRGGKIYRGGLRTYVQLRKDLDLWMKQDHAADSWFTTMVDLYKLPSDFPSMAKSREIVDPLRRVEFLEQSFRNDVGGPRFAPYIQLHEFEALLFSHPESFSIAFPAIGSEVKELRAIRQACSSPEHINDREDYAPSKRILTILPAYDKVAFGPLIAKHIGLVRLRRECRHFNSWLSSLEAAG